MTEPVRAYGVHPLKRLEAKAVELANADSMDDRAYRKVRELLRKIASQYKAKRRSKTDNLQKPTKTPV